MLRLTLRLERRHSQEHRRPATVTGGWRDPHLTLARTLVTQTFQLLPRLAEDSLARTHVRLLTLSDYQETNAQSACGLTLRHVLRVQEAKDTHPQWTEVQTGIDVQTNAGALRRRYTVTLTLIAAEPTHTNHAVGGLRRDGD